VLVVLYFCCYEKCLAVALQRHRVSCTFHTLPLSLPDVAALQMQPKQLARRAIRENGNFGVTALCGRLSDGTHEAVGLVGPRTIDLWSKYGIRPQLFQTLFFCTLLRKPMHDEHLCLVGAILANHCMASPFLWPSLAFCVKLLPKSRGLRRMRSWKAFTLRSWKNIP